MRRATIQMAPMVLARMLMGHEMSKVTTDLPPDTEIFGARWDADRHLILLDVESAAFGDVPESAIAPRVDVVVTATWTAETAVYELLRPPCQQCRVYHDHDHLGGIL